MTIKIEVAGNTDIGIVRKNNEDNYGFDTELGVFVLCDGVGGHAAGEVASQLAVDTVLNYFRTAAKSDTFPQLGEPGAGLSPLGNAVLSAIRLANTAVHEAAAQNAARKGMGSTIVLVVIRDQSIVVGHAGDSRVYLLRDAKLRLLTMDDSLVMEQVRRGYISAEEAERSPMQNIILKSLGSTANIDPHVQELPAQDNDLLLLACDGLTKVISAGDLTSLLLGEPDLQRTTALLIEVAKNHKSDDNVTCLLIRLAQ